MADPIYVAIVDDHELFRDGLKLVLSQINPDFIITEASNGLEFLKSLGSSDSRCGSHGYQYAWSERRDPCSPAPLAAYNA